jgi:hypothetical protein
MTRKVAILAAAIAALTLGAGPASALSAPVLDLSSTRFFQTATGKNAPHIPTSDPVPAGTYAHYDIAVSNTGDEETSQAITVDFEVPPGVEIVEATDESAKLLEEIGFPPFWECSIAGDAQSAACTGLDPNGLLGGPFPIGPGEEACVGLLGITCHLIFSLKVDAGASPGTVHPGITACGGSVTTCPIVAASPPDDPFDVIPFGFAIASFDGTVLKQNGDPATQAGTHPYTVSTDISLRTAVGANRQQVPIGTLKDATVNLPAGFVGNPRALPQCSADQLANLEGNCPAESQVGTVVVEYLPTGGTLAAGVYNMEVPFGRPALLGFNTLGTITQVYAGLRMGTDYGVTVTSKNSPEILPIKAVHFHLWGVPADPSHDAERLCPGDKDPGCPSDDSDEPKAFFSLPTSCGGPGPNGSVETFLDITSWLGEEDGASFFSHDNGEPPEPIGTDGCNAVPFAPTLKARPTTIVADAPSGLDIDLHIPQSDEPDGTATAHLRDTTVTLPKGLVINPSGANGLDGCAPDELGLVTPPETIPIQTTPEPAACPDASRLGSVEVDTPLLEKPLVGSVYLADPYDNPFKSLLAIYIAVDDQKTGIVLKLAGEVHVDPDTGQLTSTFEENPQQPFEHFRLKFFGGAGAALRTPAVCGNYTTTSSLTPWTAPDSGPPATPEDNWSITQGASGGPCAGSESELSFAPDLDAGTVSPIAGSYSTLVDDTRLQAGSEEIATEILTLPPGLTAKLAGVPYCPDSAMAAAASKSGQEEKSNPSCPAASEIGTVDIAVGTGPAPYWTQGKLYLIGPYKGYPVGAVVITPAVAGPFDLGTVVDKVALRINPVTAQVTAENEPIPRILQGIPVTLRQFLVRLNRPNFSLNGTSCDPLAFSGSHVSIPGRVAPFTERFQLAECTGLPFKPKLSISLLGRTRRTSNPRLVATVNAAPGEANIAKARVTLPSIAFLDNDHIGTVCTRVQFVADQCPEESIYGSATAITPLLDYPLSGPVYLRSSDHELPDLVVALRGPGSQPIEIELAGITDSVKGALRNTFEAVPDAPVSSFRLELLGGKKGLVELSRNLCAKPYRAKVELEGQNAKLYETKPRVKSKCGKKRRRHHKRAQRHAVR